MFNDFDKEIMMDDYYGTYVYKCAKEIPMSVERLDKCISFISNYIHNRNNIIKRYEEEGKDTKHLVYERDYALYVLGLGEEPKRYWMEESDDWLGDL